MITGVSTVYKEKDQSAFHIAHIVIMFETKSGYYVRANQHV